MIWCADGPVRSHVKTVSILWQAQAPICYGERDGKTARCGGWGELFSDEGSGYWIAREGLALFTKMSDGRVKRGPLHRIIKQRLNLKKDLDLPGLILDEWGGQRHKIAALSRTVDEAVHAGDEQARKIFIRAGQELANLVERTRTKTQIQPKRTCEIILFRWHIQRRRHHLELVHRSSLIASI